MYDGMVVKTSFKYMHMCQSRVEIKPYSVAYFDRITVTAFEAL